MDDVKSIYLAYISHTMKLMQVWPAKDDGGPVLLYFIVYRSRSLCSHARVLRCIRKPFLLDAVSCDADKVICKKQEIELG